MVLKTFNVHYVHVKLSHLNYHGLHICVSVMMTKRVKNDLYVKQKKAHWKYGDYES